MGETEAGQYKPGFVIFGSPATLKKRLSISSSSQEKHKLQLPLHMQDLGQPCMRRHYLTLYCKCHTFVREERMMSNGQDSDDKCSNRTEAQERSRRNLRAVGTEHNASCELVFPACQELPGFTVRGEASERYDATRNRGGAKGKRATVPLCG